MTDAERLVEVETKLAFQERTIAQLQEVLLDQQKQIDRLRLQLEKLRSRLDSAPGDDPRDEPPPPHYFRSI